MFPSSSFKSLAVTPENRRTQASGRSRNTCQQTKSKSIKRRECVELNQFWNILTWKNQTKTATAMIACTLISYGSWLWIEIIGYSLIESFVGVLVMITLSNFVCSLCTVRWVEKYGNWEGSMLSSTVYSQINYIGKLGIQIHDHYLNAESPKTTLTVLLFLWLFLFIMQTIGPVAVSLLSVPSAFILPAVFIRIYESSTGQELNAAFNGVPRWWKTCSILCVMLLSWPFSNIITKTIILSICMVLIRCQLKPEEVYLIEKSINQSLNPILKTTVKLMSGWLREAVAYAEAEGIISPPKYQQQKQQYQYSLSQRQQVGTILEFQDSEISNKENIQRQLF